MNITRSRGALSALTAAAVALTFYTNAVAQTKTLYVGMNGGTIETAYTKFVFPTFERINDVKVVVVPGTSSDILAKAQANKERPQMHLMLLDDGLMVRAIDMGLCQKQRPSPAMKDIYPIAHVKDDMATAVSISMTGLGYNTKMFKEKGWAPPTSWMDMADPKFKRRLVFPSITSSSFGLHGFLMFNRIQGGSEQNVEPGFAAWPKLVGPNMPVYIPNSAKIAEMVQAGDVALFPTTPSTVAGLKNRGIPVDYAQPREGSVVLMVEQCVIANNSEPELSQKLAEFMLSPLAQTVMLEFDNAVPTNTKAPVTGAGVIELVASIKQWLKNAVVLDWAAVNANRPAWNARWSRTIER